MGRSRPVTTGKKSKSRKVEKSKRPTAAGKARATPTGKGKAATKPAVRGRAAAQPSAGDVQPVGSDQPHRPLPTAESLEERRRRARRIIAGLRKLYPDATCALKHVNALQLLVATILSAQSTDETVNKVTPELFDAYPTPESLSATDAAEIERIIHRTGFFRQKTKSIMGACQTMVEKFNSQVPDTMEGLLQLRGVARKTANVVLGTWFGRNEGVVVDTHVGRLAHRLGLTWTGRNEKDAVRIEQDLMQVLPREEWTYTGHALIWHGRRICTARKPKCGQCTLNKLCPSAFTFE